MGASEGNSLAPGNVHVAPNHKRNPKNPIGKGVNTCCPMSM